MPTSRTVEHTIIDASDWDLMGKEYSPKKTRDFGPEVSIIRSEWGYYAKIDYRGNGSVVEVIWSKTLRRVHKRASKRVEKYLRNKEWKENPLVLHADPDTHKLLPTGMTQPMLTAGD